MRMDSSKLLQVYIKVAKEVFIILELRLGVFLVS